MDIKLTLLWMPILFFFFMQLIAGGEGEVITFVTPPTAFYQRPADPQDWRAFKTVSLSWERLSPAPQEPIVGSFFIVTQNHFWFVSREKEDFKNERGTFVLSLQPRDADWEGIGHRRPFHRDVLSHIHSWGLTIFSRQPISLQLRLGSLKLEKGDDDGFAHKVSWWVLPEYKIMPGQKLTMVTFRVGYQDSQFIDPQHIRGILEIDNLKGDLPAMSPLPLWSTGFHYTQDYYPFQIHAYHPLQMIPYNRPHWQARYYFIDNQNLVAKITFFYKGEKLFSEFYPLNPNDSKSRCWFEIGSIPPNQWESMTNLPLDLLKFTEEIHVSTLYLAKYHAPSQAVVWEEVNPQTYPLDPQFLWRVQLDWTAKWGCYSGIGCFNHLLANLFDFHLYSQKVERPRLLTLFTEDELDDTGIFNWKDHPWNVSNGGPLNSPLNFYTYPLSQRLLQQRAEYLWSRYGAYPGIAGLYLHVTRTHPQTVQFFREVIHSLLKLFPHMKIFTNLPLLPNLLPDQMELKLTGLWKRNFQLGNAPSGLSLVENTLQIKVQFPGVTAIEIDQLVLHFSGYDYLVIPIECGEVRHNPIKVQIFMRNDKGVVFQSKLYTLLPQEHNQLFVSLNSIQDWNILQHGFYTRERYQWHPYEFMNIHSFAIRFFGDDSDVVTLRIHNPILVRQDLIHSTSKKTSITLRSPIPEKLRCFEPFSFDFDINTVVNNPYDPEEIDITLTLEYEGEKTIFSKYPFLQHLLTQPWKHPAFFYEPWNIHLMQNKESVLIEGSPYWKVRVTPFLPGHYRWKLEVLFPKISETVSHATLTGHLVVTNEPVSPGFVVISPQNPRYFEFLDGTFFYPIGHNLRSPSERRSNAITGRAEENADWADRMGIFAYQSWFKKMNESGANFTRIWMSPWWCGLEWNPRHPGYHGIGYYNQINAARLDQLIQFAEQEQIYINLETINHGTISTLVDKDWDGNPYNRKHPGGFLRYASDFFTSDQAKRYHRQRLRYTIARWGYSPSIAIWGLLTETEWTEAWTRSLPWARSRRAGEGEEIPQPYGTSDYLPIVEQWLVEMANYIRTTDLHPHLISHHFSNPQNGIETWKNKQLQVIHNNAYTSFTDSWMREKYAESDGVADIIREVAHFYTSTYSKPVIIGEWGGHPVKNTVTHLQAEFHTGIWASSLTLLSGSVGFWWWNILDAYNLYPHYQGLAKFWKGEDRRSFQNLKSEMLSSSFPLLLRYPDHRRFVISLYGDRHLWAYVYSKKINQNQNSTYPNQFDDKRFPDSGPGIIYLPPEFSDGDYQIQFWNTFTGEIIDQFPISIAPEARTLPVIPHRVDLAIKLKPLIQ